MMELRLGDLYELIVRIVDDRLKQREEAKGFTTVKGTEIPPSDFYAKSPDEQKVQALREQITALVDLQSQILESIKENQQRTEELLKELLSLLEQLLEASKISNGRRSTSLPGGASKSEGEPTSYSEKSRYLEKLSKPIELAGYNPKPISSLNGEGSDFTSLETQTSKPPSQPITDKLALNAATPVGTSSLSMKGEGQKTLDREEDLIEQLSNYLKRLFGIEVDYLSTRPTPSSSLQDAQILVGEGVHNGQAVTLTIFRKSQITPTDVTVFYNAVVRPLRGSVNGTVTGIVFGETFEPKSLKVAHALDLLVIDMKSLREVVDNKV